MNVNMLRICLVQISKRNVSSLITARKFKKAGDLEKEERHVVGWFLLILPVTTFALGTWQVKRKLWKTDLVRKIEKNTSAEPVDLPKDLSELGDKEYVPFRVKGTFLHNKEIILGPRQFISKKDAEPKNTLKKMFLAGPGENGYLVITPFKLSDRDLTILVNRGWIPTNFKSPETRKAGQIEGETELVGLFRLAENFSTFGIKNNPDYGIWLYRDLKTMSERTGSSPIFLDAIKETTVPEGPIGGQTTVSLRDNHVIYTATWYSISATTAYMWIQKYGHYLRFFK